MDGGLAEAIFGSGVHTIIQALLRLGLIQPIEPTMHRPICSQTRPRKNARYSAAGVALRAHCRRKRKAEYN
jgi:hypothetical protein